MNEIEIIFLLVVVPVISALITVVFFGSKRRFDRPDRSMCWL